MSQSNGRGTVDVNAATLLLAETPTVIVNDHVAVVGEWARPATVASAEQAATLIFDRAPANRPIDSATPTNAASTSSAVRYVVVGVAGTRRDGNGARRTGCGAAPTCGTEGALERCRARPAPPLSALAREGGEACGA